MENGIPKPRDQVPSVNAYAHNGKIMLCSGIILFTAIFCIFCFHSYVRWIFNLRSRRIRHAHRPHSDPSSANVAAQGLDPSILKALPLLAYGSKTTGPAALECAVCLSEFQDGDKGRVLPKCKHTFHIGCIDLWFRSHSNCPLCRAPVLCHNIPEICPETFVPVIEMAGLQAELRQKKEDERCCSASSSPASLSPLQCQRISSALLGIMAEVPTSTGEQRLTGLSPSGPSGQLIGLLLDANFGRKGGKTDVKLVDHM